MPENGTYDWNERMRRLEDMVERNWADHDRIDRNIAGLHTSLIALKDNTDKLVTAIRELIDRIPPESLKPPSV
jgi:coenzyme F420-reducing hydrogenase delta subunit